MDLIGFGARRRTGRLAALAAAAVVVAVTTAPAGAGAQAQLVSLPLEEVLDGEMELVVGERSATLRLATTVPLACAVVFGRDTGFGSIASDMSMAGAAQRDHEVVLRGLEPDTEYLYRVQGSAASGAFYASQVLRFRTAAAQAQGIQGVNVATAARGAVVDAASSEFGAGFAAAHAIDGQPTTEWSSRGDGDGAFITISLPEEVEFVGFGLWTRTMGASAQIASFEVETDRGEVFGPFRLADADALHAFAATGRGRTFTFRVLESSGGNTGAVEVAVYVDEVR